MGSDILASRGTTAQQRPQGDSNPRRDPEFLLSKRWSCQSAVRIDNHVFHTPSTAPLVPAEQDWAVCFLHVTGS